VQLYLERALDPAEKECPRHEDLSDARLVRLFDHWEDSVKRAGGLPPVSTIDPLELRFILGWLMIIEPVAGGADFKYRLFGTEIASIQQRDLTGCMVSDSFPNFARWTSEVYRKVMARKAPMLTHHSPQRYVAVDRWERLILPYVNEAGEVARLLVGAVITRKLPGAEDTGLPWPLRDFGKASQTS
jgi:hypothetical protein